MKKKDKKRKGIFMIYIILILALLFLYAKYIEPFSLTIHEYKIEDKLLPNNFNGLKIVHFSDVHYGRTVDMKYLNKIINLINKQKPDIVIFTGDFIDKDIKLKDNEIKDIKNALSKIESTIGNYAVIGNHDVYNLDDYKKILDGNFNLLENKEELIYYENDTPISLVGLSDLTEKLIDYSVLDKENNYYRIVLSHEGDSLLDIKDKNINIMFSGHSHGGQVRIPFIGPIILPDGSKTYYDKYYKVDETKLYVSNGIGTSRINLRFLSRPSINLYRFYN